MTCVPVGIKNCAISAVPKPLDERGHPLRRPADSASVHWPTSCNVVIIDEWAYVLPAPKLLCRPAGVRPGPTTWRRQSWFVCTVGGTHSHGTGPAEMRGVAGKGHAPAAAIGSAVAEETSARRVQPARHRPRCRPEASAARRPTATR